MTVFSLGKLESNSEIGIALSNALTILQSVKFDEIMELANEKSQDLLMVSYLATLTQTQLQISEKINSIF
jgi:hypothetical protein